MKRKFASSKRWLAMPALLFACAVVAAGNYSDFLAALRQRESSGNSHSINGSGYVGLYQMGESAMIDAGYYRPDGTGRNDWRGTWTGKNGINSLNDFLNNSTVQTQAITTYHDMLWHQITGRHLDTTLGSTFNGIPVTQSGLIAAAHLIGVGGLKQCMNGGKCTDGNNTTAMSYMRRFGGFDVSNLTGPNPIAANPNPKPSTPLPDATPGESNTNAPFPASATSPSEAFADGAGVSMAAIKETVLGILCVVSLLLAAWITKAQYSVIRKGRSTIADMKFNMVSSMVFLSAVLLVALT